MHPRTLKWRALAGTLLASCALMAHGQPTGQWDFNDPADGLNASLGGDLQYYNPETSTATAFGTTTSFGIPNIGGEPAQVMRFPEVAGGGYYIPFMGQPNGGGGLINEYTVVMDILFPEASSGRPRALLDVDLGLISPDAEFFVNADNGIGQKGQSFGQVQPNTWHRIAFVSEVPDGSSSIDLRMYVDGMEVGVRRSVTFIDDRFALLQDSNGSLFWDNDGETAPGYVNSIQLWDRALSRGEIRALGAPTASGLPQELPPIPSGIESWHPPGEFASRDASVGAVIAMGSTIIQDSSFSLKLNEVELEDLTITREGDLITVLSGAQSLTPGTMYTLEISYTDSLAGAKSFSKTFTAALLFEDFEGLELGPGLEEAHAADIGWTDVPPAGWSIVRTNMAGWDSPDNDGDGRPDNDGRSEWFGWSFAAKEWWVRADTQRREEFSLAIGTVAIADPDEWDDMAHAQGLFNSDLITLPISITGVAADTAFLRFHSSWRPECCDDGPPSFPEGNINNQTAIITVSYDGSEPIEVMKWDSRSGSPTYHDHNPNESVLIQLNNPAGAQEMVLTFSLVNAANDWWWAIDNIVVNAGAAAPQVVQHPVGSLVSEGGQITLSVTASGTEPFTYEWRLDGDAIAGATGPELVLNNVQPEDAGTYTVVVSNAGGFAESAGALLEVFSGAITEALVAHLKFDNDLADASGGGNNGTAVGSPGFQTGKIGSAVQVTSGANYVSLGAPEDLNFGTSTDFSISFWAQINGLSGDPSIIGNKDWNSGGNQGYVLFSADNRRIDWNQGGLPGSPRKDSDGIANVFPNDTWAHVAVTFDRDGNAITYVNGNRVEVIALAGAVMDVSTPAGYATNIGQDGTGSYGSSFSDLRVDDLGIWRRQLTPQEVFAIFEGGNDGQDLSQAVFSGAQLPEITQHPANTTAIAGLGATFTVAATGAPPLEYQWQFEGGDIEGATSATLALSNVSQADAGSYRVIVTNPAGSTTSSAATLTVTPAPAAAVTGQWDFDNGDLSATVGQALEYRGDTAAGTTFTTLQINGEDAQVMAFPATSPSQGFVMPHGAAPNGGGQYVNLYTLIYDLMFPAASSGTWRALFQTSTGNANDGDLFVNPGNGIGISGNYTGTVQADTWHRVAFVVNSVNGRLSKYIDGVKVGEQSIEGLDGRFSLDPTALLFTDEGNETAAGYVNSIQFRNWVMTDEEIATLGGPTASGIPGSGPSGTTVSVSREGQNLVITASEAGTYQLQRKTSLDDENWTNVGAPGAGPFNVLIEGSTAFFRIEQQ